MCLLYYVFAIYTFKYIVDAKKISLNVKILNIIVSFVKYVANIILRYHDVIRNYFGFSKI